MQRTVQDSVHGLKWVVPTAGQSCEAACSAQGAGWRFINGGSNLTDPQSSSALCAGFVVLPLGLGRQWLSGEELCGVERAVPWHICITWYFSINWLSRVYHLLLFLWLLIPSVASRSCRCSLQHHVCHQPLLGAACGWRVHRPVLHCPRPQRVSTGRQVTAAPTHGNEVCLHGLPRPLL